jgi:hypothetical protein
MNWFIKHSGSENTIFAQTHRTVTFNRKGGCIMKKPMAATSCLLPLWMIILMVLFNAPQATAQSYEYVPFADNATWSINWQKYKTVGDTVIDNLHYLKVYGQVEDHPFEFDINEAHLTAFIRNDTVNKRMYSRYLMDTTERLQYDFSMQVGDTITLTDGYHDYYAIRVNEVSISTGQNQPPYTLNVNNIDSIITLTDGSKRRQQLMHVIPTQGGIQDIRTVPQIWIEGIGGSTELFLERYRHIYWTVDGGYPRLLCYTENSMPLLVNSVFDIDTNENDCWSLEFGLGIANNPVIEDIKLYPNPTTSQINIEISDLSSLNHSIARIYNMQGVCLQTVNITSFITTLSLDSYSSGMYLIVIQQKNREKYYSKIIKN